MRNVVKNSLLLFISTLFALLISELVVRFFFPQNLYPFVYKDDPLVSYRLKENYRGIHKAPEFSVKVETNSAGHRDYEHSIVKPENVYRIMVLGDSFTFGEGVEMDESYPKVVEERLNKGKRGRRYEIINVSAYNWGTLEEYLYLKHYGIKYRPDMVVMAFFIGNDFYQNRFGPFSVKKDKIVYSPLESVNGKMNRLLKYIPGYMYVRERSELLALLRKRANYYLEHDIFEASSEMMMSLYTGKLDSDVQKAIENTKGLIEKTAKIAKEKEFELVILLIPADEQLNPERYGIPNVSEPYFPNHIMHEIGEKNGIAVVDLLPYFRERSRGGREFYYEINGHWNKQGHMLAGETLEERILSFLQFNDDGFEKVL